MVKALDHHGRFKAIQRKKHEFYKISLTNKNNSFQDILTGASNISLTGGTENMSSLPLLVRNVRFGTALGGSYHLEDYITKQYLDSYTGLTLQQLAEDVAKRCGVTREEADEFALQSHSKWKAGD